MALKELAYQYLVKHQHGIEVVPLRSICTINLVKKSMEATENELRLGHAVLIGYGFAKDLTENLVDDNG